LNSIISPRKHLGIRKRNKQNVFCESISMLPGYPSKIRAKLSVSEKHPFFFDHPLDHVSGLQLAESMLQLADLLADIDYGGDEKNHLYVSEIEVDFKTFCRLDQTADIHIVEMDKSGESESDHHFYRGVINDCNKELCRGRFRISMIPSPKRGNSFQPANTNRQHHIPPCAKELINKTYEENVFISDPSDDRHAVGTTFSILPLRNHTFFSDTPDKGLPTLYLLEAFMQTQRFIRYLTNYDQQYQYVTSKDILKSVKISLERPVGVNESPCIKLQPTVCRDLGKGLLRSGNATLMIDTEVIGNCNIRTVVIDDDLLSALKNINAAKKGNLV